MPQLLYDLLDLVIFLTEYIEKELGGKAQFVNYETGKYITIYWKKYMLHFSYKITYTELALVKEPLILGQAIIEKYNEEREKDA